MGQIMAECDCDCRDACQDAQECLAERRVCEAAIAHNERFQQWLKSFPPPNQKLKQAWARYKGSVQQQPSSKNMELALVYLSQLVAVIEAKDPHCPWILNLKDILNIANKGQS